MDDTCLADLIKKHIQKHARTYFPEINGDFVIIR